MLSSFAPLRRTRSSRRRALFAWLLAAACLAASCEPTEDAPTPRLPARLESDWIADAAVRRDVERSAWDPLALTGPWTYGRHPWIREDDTGPFLWSHLDETRWSAEILRPGPRRLVLDGFPAPSPDGRPQRVEVRIDGHVVGSAKWSRAGRRFVDVPADLLAPGVHRIALCYRYTADDPAGGPGSEARAMAWRKIAWEKHDAADDAGSSPPSVWWRFVNVTEPATLLVRGRALAAGTRAAVLVDRGTGLWEERASARADSGAPLRLAARVSGEPGDVVRLGLAVTGGAAAWDSVRSVSAVPATRRPVVLLSLDTTRRDALGCYASGPVTPHLDRLAREGTVWDMAFSPTPATGPAHATVFLSRDPSEHGVHTNGRSLPRAGGGDLAVQLCAIGYETAAFVSLGTVAADLGFAQAFDTFDDELDRGWWRFAAAVNERALPWIAAHPQGEKRAPGFLWVHYSDPHRPYGTADEPGQGVRILLNGDVIAERAPTLGLEQSWPVELRPGDNEIELVSSQDYDDDREHWFILREREVAAEGAAIALGEGWRSVRSFPRMKRRATLRVQWPAGRPTRTTLALRIEDNPTAEEARRRYDREVTAMDTAVGELLGTLDAAGWLQEGIVFAFADHGEDLGEEGHWGHIHHLGATLTRVPMLLWGRAVSARRIGELVGLIDVAPTVAALLGVPPSSLWRGMDALAPPAERRLYLETFPPEAHAHLRGVVELPYCLAGPAEGGVGATTVTDLWTGRESEPRAGVSALREAWTRWIEEAPGLPEAGPQTRERLRALGYLP